MNDADETQAPFARLVARRHVLLRALAVVGATAGLSACKHLPGNAGPTGSGDGKSDGGGGEGGGGEGGGGEGGGGY